MFISKNYYELKRDYINHYDLYPTILDFMSFRYPGNRLGSKVIQDLKMLIMMSMKNIKLI